MPLPDPPLLPDLERLTNRILHPHNPTPPPEDIFSSGLEALFTEDTLQSHGVPGESVIYRSPRFGDVFLRIPAHPDEEHGRSLFAHYLWNSGVIVAEGIEQASSDEESGGRRRDKEGEEQMVDWDKRFWDMRGLDILELGAATALPSIVAALSSARSVTSTDHPSSPAITTNAIESNFRINLTERRSNQSETLSAPKSTPHDDRNGASAAITTGGTGVEDGQGYTNSAMPSLYQPPVTTSARVSVHGYVWGTTTFYATGGFGQPSAEQPLPHSFDRIIIADCLWMPVQHENLVNTISTYLKKGTNRQEENETSPPPLSCALVVAAFHTGRAVVRDFVVIATGSAMGGTGDQVAITQKEQAEEPNSSRQKGCEEASELEDRVVRGKLMAVQIFEVDVDGRRRDWEPERPGETKEQLKRWCVCAILANR